ncbi:unnamed protein product [Rhizoctonia solani]|uniref:SET domain-containing protein n=1 Tax=Rhizoctonia solani TaxID=456999 RepID=A0A8H3HBI1_9AGAM|nr:unnamed protein product [Rhizoctonia solani]
MAHRGQLDSQLAEQAYLECWDQFQTWASQHTSKTLRFDHLFNLDDEDDEELDESLFRAGSRNHTVHEADRELRVSYYDPIEIDLEDDLLEPTLGPSPTSPHWLNTFTTKPIPPYGSFSHIRQRNYIRGDVWTRKPTGERIRLVSGEDEEVSGEDEDGGRVRESRKKGKNKKETKEKEPLIEIKESLMDTVKARRLVRSRTLTNLEVDDHPATNPESMPFVPPEMKRRRMRGKLLHYEESFIDIEAWQHLDAGWENDEDIIGAETVRRLLHIHQMTEERVDRTKVIPQDIRKLYAFLRHRTYPDLDVIFPREPPLPQLPLDEWVQKDEQANLESRIREKAFNICCKIHCQVIMCPTHYAARERALIEQEVHETLEAQEGDNVIRRGRGPQIPRWEVPKLSAHKLFAKFKREKRNRCGEDCFYSLGVPEHGDLSLDVTEPESDPDAQTQADIETIWKVDPDAVPCDVAELSWDKVTCRQAYNIRNGLYNYLSEPEPDEDHPGIEERRGGHSGGQVSRHCIRDCKCDMDCKHRRTGCNCRSSSKYICLTPKSKKDPNHAHGCKCSDNGLECDPELCKGCKARWSPLFERWDSDEAMEGMIWLATHPKLSLPSQYGNGLFLAGNAVENDVISGRWFKHIRLNHAEYEYIDYMGDICLPRTSLRRSLMAEANERNYLFDIPNYFKVSIDAGYTGNESRFANHPSNGNANCSAKYVWSGDDKHIALYATGHIWDGNELFLHYGSNFWRSEMPEGDYGGEIPSEQGSEEQSSEVEILEEEVEDNEQGFSDESVDL